MGDAEQAGTREDVVRTARRMLAEGLVTGTSGNLSVRCGDAVLITPSSVDYTGLTPADLVLVGLDGTVRDAGKADRLPSSELPLHLAVYASTPDAAAVVHTHSRFATAVGLVLDELPAVHYAVNGLGGRVRVAPYATFGSAELAAGVAAALDGRTGALMRNHGAVTVGPTLAAAYDDTVRLEWLCELWWRARQVGEPALLTDDQLAAAREQARLRRYRS